MILDTVVMALDISQENLSQMKQTNKRVGALEKELRDTHAALKSYEESPSTSNRLAFLVPCYSEENLDQLEEALQGSSQKEWIVSGFSCLLLHYAATYLRMSQIDG